MFLQRAAGVKRSRNRKWKSQTRTRLQRQDSVSSEVLKADLSIRYNHVRGKNRHGFSKIKIPAINSTFFVFPQAKRVLPQWLAEPDVIHRDIKCNLVPLFSVSGVSAQLLRKLEANGIQHFFPGTVDSPGGQPGLLWETAIDNEACVMLHPCAAY